ncbi:membrane-spanning 4-domains subfamily A member 6B-like isoform 2-T3 [Discoglossus pictus]
MSVSKTQVGDVCVTTRVVPGIDPGAAALCSETPPLPTTPWTSLTTKNMKTFRAKAFGTVLILVAVIELSFGVMLLAAEGDQPSLTVRSGVYIWGGLAVLVAGCVTVALETKESINMVKACVGCNLANLLLGGLSIILFAVQLHKETQACWVSIDRELTSSCYSIYNMTARQDYFYYYGESNYVAPLRVAVNSLAILYASLGIIITTCVLLFIWKAVKATKYSLLN